MAGDVPTWEYHPVSQSVSIRGTDHNDLIDVRQVSGLVEIDFQTTTQAGDVASGTLVTNVQMSRLQQLHVFSGDGNDSVSVDSSLKTRSGEPNDYGQYTTVGLTAVIDGGAGDDSLTGGSGDDVILGGPGTDQIFGGSGNDLIDGGLGSDSIDGQVGHDYLLADSDDMSVVGGNGYYDVLDSRRALTSISASVADGFEAILSPVADAENHVIVASHQFAQAIFVSGTQGNDTVSVRGVNNQVVVDYSSVVDGGNAVSATINTDVSALNLDHVYLLGDAGDDNLQLQPGLRAKSPKSLIPTMKKTNRPM